MTLVLLVGLAAGLGALARFALDLAVSARHDSVLPWGTFAVNVSGSFLLGLVTGWAVHRDLDADVAAVLSAGFLGGYTTWSTWMWETVALAERGAGRAATLNVVGSVLAGLLAAAAGLALGSR